MPKYLESEKPKNENKKEIRLAPPNVRNKDLPKSVLHTVIKNTLKMHKS